MHSYFIHSLPDEIQRNICTLALRRIRFEKHQEYFRDIHEELKENDFEDIIHLKVSELTYRDVKMIMYPELSDSIKDWTYFNELMYHYKTTSTMVYKDDVWFNIIGNADTSVHCYKCNMTKDGLVNHKKRILECKECKLNETR